MNHRPLVLAVVYCEASGLWTEEEEEIANDVELLPLWHDDSYDLLQVPAAAGR